MSLYFDNEKLFDAEGHLTDEGLYALKDGTPTIWGRWKRPSGRDPGRRSRCRMPSRHHRRSRRTSWR